MTLEQIRKSPTVATASIAAAMEHSDSIFSYISSCFQRFYSGDYGEMGAEDTNANNAELAAGEGRIVARYKAQQGLEEDIYIISVFSAENPGNKDYNNTCVMYCSEY